MLSLPGVLSVITIASITNQVHAQNFVQDALENLQKHQVAESKYLKDKYHESRHDEDNDSNVNSVSIQDLSALLEQVLNTNAEYEVKKRTYDSKNQKYTNYLDKLNEQNLDDVLVYYPDSKKPKRTEEMQRNTILNTLGLLDAKPNFVGIKEIHKSADQKESQVNKKRNYEKNFLDQLNELDKDNVIMYDPDSDRPIHTERKQKNPLMDLLGSTNNAVDSDDLNNEALVYVVQLNADRIRNKKNHKNSLNELVSTQFKMPSASQNDRSDQRKEHRYKGFRVTDVLRRRGDAHEKFASEEMEEKRPAKRPRGFGGVARTPIPYIRHRGDIYEKYL